ncbi:glycoside hydrolase family 9 protein [Acidobacteriota bacterium]
MRNLDAFSAAILLMFTFMGAVIAGAGPANVDDHFKVDQFGYRPGAAKVAVISDPVTGYNAPDPFAPSAMLEVRRWDDDTVAFSGPAIAWNGGAEHAQSGDRAWWFDFTALTETGSFYIYDQPQGVGSGCFEIGDSVYAEVLEQAVRSFLYQRCGTAKLAEHAGPSWVDSACHVGTEQDLDCRSVLDPVPGTSLDLTGGWHDAGDYNKYINFADLPVHDLLAAYEDHPDIWPDGWGIPESGNGIPDLLDEVKWELDWFLRMQRPSGAVLHKISVTDWSADSPPSADTAPRRYAGETASATISACGVFAHAAFVYGGLSDPAMQAYGDQLRTAAVAAWDWLEANPTEIPSSYDNAGFVNSSSEDDDYQQEANHVCAAAYLLVLTGDGQYRDHFDQNYQNVHLLQWTYAYPFEPEYQDCLLYYGRSPLATRSVIGNIRTAYTTSMQGNDNLGHVLNEDDAYRAYLADGDYTWGSNRTKAHQGCMYINMNLYGLDAPNADNYSGAAEGYLHYLHGLNPIGMVNLTNMASYGAENSAQEVYHGWFHDGTDWDNATTSLYGPAPGIVPGGANPNYAPDPSYTGPPIEPPENQPIQKSYRDWNTTWPENSWEVTENSITYQGAYIKLLSAFVPAPPFQVSAPSDQTVCMGDSAAFQVMVTGGTPPYSYQWRKEGADLIDGGNISGATTDTLMISPVGMIDAGNYDVVVTDMNSDQITSANAILTVQTMPGSPGNTLRAVRSGGDINLSWAATGGATSYEVWRCDATAGPCTPVLWAIVDVPAFNETAPAGLFWYRVVAVNDCGQTP